MFNSFISLVREIYQTDQSIPLHQPCFQGNELQYLKQVIDSNYVSTIGPFVHQFEVEMAEYCGSRYAIATVNGTAALHIALLLAGVKTDEEVITQAVSFVATANAIHYCGAKPIFIDIDLETLSLSAQALAGFLAKYAERRETGVWNKRTGKRIAACLPMHSFGHPADMQNILKVCASYGLEVIEDAAEAVGSLRDNKQCGNFGKLGILSFNGNKIMTTGGGGMILTNDEILAQQAKHLTTTAKIPHNWEFVHDQIGFNYRMPNLNAALGLAQLQQLPSFLKSKRKLAEHYINWAKEFQVDIVTEPTNSCSNYWLNALLLSDQTEKEAFLAATNAQGVMTRPLWELLSNLPMYKDCQTDQLENSKQIATRLVNIPSSVVQTDA